MWFLHDTARFGLWLHTRLTLLCINAGRRLFTWIPIIWGAGVLLYFAPCYEPRVVPALLILGVGGLALRAGWRDIVLRCGSFTVILFTGGFVAAWHESHTQPPMPFLPRHAVVMTGQVCGVNLMAPRVAGQKATRRVKICNAQFHDWLNEGMQPLRRYLLIRLRPDDDAPLTQGQGLKLRAMLHLPPWPNAPGARDMQREAWFSGEAGRGYALGHVIVSPQTQRMTLNGVRQRIAQRIARRLSGQVAAIAQTVLVGETGGLSAQTRAEFAASGLAHILAVAGLHLGLVMGFVLFAVRNGFAMWTWAALHWPCRQIAVIIAWVAGCVYVLLTGAHLPAVRSLGMALFIVIALLTGRQALSLRAWTLVALAFLVIRPSAVLEISFQMSFAAVLALICGYEALRPILRSFQARSGAWSRVLLHLLLLAATSFFAGLATLPIVAAHFNVIQPWFILANMVAVPVAGLIVMPLGVVALLATPFHADGIFLHGMGVGIELIASIARIVTRLPLARVAIPRAPWWSLVLYGFALSGLCLSRGWWRATFCGAILAVTFTPFFVARPDILLSADGSLLGVRKKNTLFVTRPGFLHRWVATSWESDLALHVQSIDVFLRRDGNQCVQDVCRMVINGRTILINRARFPSAAATHAGWCAQTVLVINLPPARALCPGAREINRATTWREGAMTINVRPAGLQILSDRSWRGTRLWSPQNGNIGLPNLPLAPSE